LGVYLFSRAQQVTPWVWMDGRNEQKKSLKESSVRLSSRETRYPEPVPTENRRASNGTVNFDCRGRRVKKHSNFPSGNHARVKGSFK